MILPMPDGGVGCVAYLNRNADTLSLARPKMGTLTASLIRFYTATPSWWKDSD
jgi:hypothetical protein